MPSEINSLRSYKLSHFLQSSYHSVVHHYRRHNCLHRRSRATYWCTTRCRTETVSRCTKVLLSTQNTLYNSQLLHRRHNEGSQAQIPNSTAGSATCKLCRHTNYDSDGPVTRRCLYQLPAVDSALTYRYPTFSGPISDDIHVLVVWLLRVITYVTVCLRRLSQFISNISQCTSLERKLYSFWLTCGFLQTSVSTSL